MRSAGSASSQSSEKCSATCVASQLARWNAHRKFADTAAAACSSTQPVSWSQIFVGSPLESISSSASRKMSRIRSRRSWSMSALRSATPSLSVCCQRADRSFSAAERPWDSVSSPISSWIVSGLSWALFSERRPPMSWSVTASTSWIVERRASLSACPTTRSRR